MDKTKLIELQSLLKAKHKPACQQDSMVWQVWEDGEVTLQKGGELWGQRNLHLIFGASFPALPIEAMPVKTSNNHGYLIVENEKEMRDLLTLMSEYAKD